jgi:hypothetical protein
MGPNFFNSDDQLPGVSDVPSYILAADNHNIGNTRGGSWLDPDTWSDKFSGAGSLIATGILSGANSFYNTGVTIGNWFGADAELNDTAGWISSIDSDLGQYYSKNRQAADLVGFVAGSLLPGLGGIKVLNAGQKALTAASKTGLLGENISRATGLLVPQTERYVAAAAKDITSATATFSSINQNGIKALASGVYQNVLEGVAFETAVQATMFKSPILEDQDRWDIVKNIAMGGAFQGVIGGAFTAASSLGAIRKAVTKESAFLTPMGSRVIPEAGTSPAEKIILMTEDLVYSAQPAKSLENYDAAQKIYLDKVRRTQNDIRSAFHELAGDTDLGNMLADAHFGSDQFTAMNNLLGAQEVTRLGKLTKAESAAAKAAKEGKLPDESITHSYVKLTGEGAGTVTDSEPLVHNLADRVVGKAAADTQKGVLDLVRDYGFKPGELWDASKLSSGVSHLEAEARYIWADSVMKEIKEGTAVHQYDIPVLERALKDGMLNFQVIGRAGKVIKDGFTSTQELWNHIVNAKTDVAQKLISRSVFNKSLESGEQLESLMVGKITNTRVSRIEGTAVGQESVDFKAWQSANEDYAKMIAAKGLSRGANESLDTRFLPTYAKISRQAPDLNGLDGNIVDGMTWIKQQQALLKQGVDNVVAKATGDLYESIPEIKDSYLLGANRYGAGATLTGFANGGYGTLESIVQQLGNVTNKLKQAYRKATSEVMDGVAHGLLSSQESAIEWSTIQQKVTRSAQQWIKHVEDSGEEVEHYLITKDAAAKYFDKETGELDFDSLFSEAEDQLIRIHNDATIAAVDSHIARTGQRAVLENELRAAQGMGDTIHAGGKDPLVFRPIRANPKDYPYFAFVLDPAVTGQGHKTMIFANSEAKLQAMIEKVPQKYQVLTKRETEDFKRAYNEYEYERTLNETYINSDLKNSGVMSDFFTHTDPQKIVNDMMQQHLRQDDMLATEMMRAKNQNAFDWLEDQGDAYTKVSASKLGSYSDRLEAAGKNPYLDYTKTALDISKVGEHPWLQGFNKLLDGAVSRAVGHIADVYQEWRAPLDSTKVNEINGLLDKYGMNTGYKDAATLLLADHAAPKGELTKFVRTANAVLSKLTLGLDPLNAVNNFVGANILRGTELKQITDAINAGDTELAGKLAALTKVDLPGGVGQITTPGRLVKNAIENYFKDMRTEGKPLISQYKSAGFIKDASEQFAQILDDFTLKGTETVSELNSRLAGAFEKAKGLVKTGETWTGNKLAEELNRFISADCMRQITDLGVERGLLSPAEQKAYINTFVNRVEGNTIASQRPLMFQGPIGQAIGLFQSYQFNLMQQMFRYVAEGTAKDSAMLMGLQGTFYGLQGLPGFQFINQHIVGTASGNQNHVDLYDATYGVAGRQMGDLLMYGLPSNLLQANLYSRGDINPRQLTVIPTTLPDIPFIGAFGKFLGNVKDTVGKIAAGGDVWESMLQGLEHNGLSRPLSGLAQSLQAFGNGGVAYSTSSKGTILASNDLASWATAVRLAGGRPIDEAIINDGVYRIQAYQQYDRARLNDLGEAIKTSVIQGNMPDQGQYTKYAEEYAKAGGKQAQFNKFMMNEFKSANTSQAEKIVSQLQNPFAQKMQVLMGGGSDSTIHPSQF